MGRRAGAQAPGCTFSGYWPTTSVTTGPAVVGLVATCTAPVDRSSIVMSIDGASMATDAYQSGADWVIVLHDRAPEGNHTAQVDLVAGGQPASETWNFTLVLPVIEQPGPDSPPSVGVIERKDGSVE